MLWRVAESVLRPEMSVKHRILTGLMLQGLSVHRAKKQGKWCYPCHHDKHSFACFCYSLFTVSPYRESRATEVTEQCVASSKMGRCDFLSKDVIDSIMAFHCSMAPLL